MVNKIDQQMQQHCRDYKSSKENELHRQQCIHRAYVTVAGIAKNMVTKNFGPAGRINIDEVAHEIATSIVMNTFVKERKVDSWSNLLKKCSKDLTNRWMLKHLYSKHAINNQSISSEDPDGAEGTLIDYDFPEYQIGPEERILVAEYVTHCADRIYRIVKEYRSPQGIFIVRMAMNRALGRETIFYPHLPPRKRALVNYIESEFRHALYMATNKRLFERAIAGDSLVL